MTNDPNDINAPNAPITPASDDLGDLDMDDLDFDDLAFDDLADDLTDDLNDGAGASLDGGFDEDWDEFDDPLPHMPQFDGAPETQAPEANPFPPRKTFLQKNFNLIVIGIAAIAALLIFLYISSGTSSAPQSAPNPVADILPDDIDTPETGVATADPEPLVLSNADKAPPMPSPVSTPEENPNAVAALDLNALAPITSEPSASTAEIEPEQLEIASWEDMLAEEEQREETAIAAEAKPQTPPKAAPAVEKVVENAIEDMGEDISARAPPAATDAPKEEIKPLLIPSAPDPVDAPAISPAIAANIAASQQKAETAQQEASRLQSIITRKDQEIAALKEALSAKEASLKLEQARLAKEKAKKVQAPAPVKATPPKTISRSATPKAAPKKTVRKKARRVEWVLRAAQSNTAVIAPKGTDNLQSISVGSNVSGLGKITSIRQESGRWVIRGTLGSLSQ